MQYVESQARSAGVTVPFVNNDGTWYVLLSLMSRGKEMAAELVTPFLNAFQDLPK
jgi:hypothetical protein